MLLHDRVGDGQAEARALADLLRREEGIEDSCLDVAGYARPIVSDLEDGVVAIDVVARAHRQHASAVGAEHRLFGVD